MAVLHACASTGDGDEWTKDSPPVTARDQDRRHCLLIWCMAHEYEVIEYVLENSSTEVLGWSEIICRAHTLPGSRRLYVCTRPVGSLSLTPDSGRMGVFGSAECEQTLRPRDDTSVDSWEPAGTSGGYGCGRPGIGIHGEVLGDTLSSLAIADELSAGT